MILLLMLDAFRPDYIAGAPFLSGLARMGWHGHYQEPFGFAPRDSYFRGSEAAESGYTHMFRLDPELSPFSPARHFPSESRLSDAARFGLRQGLWRHAVAQAGPYAASYIYPFEIPFHLIPEFNVSEQVPPWQSAGGRPSIFEELRAQGRPWVYLAWPRFEELDLHSDEDVARRAIEVIGPETEFAFVQFPELDSSGHQFGPGSAEVLATVERQDELVRRILEGLEAKGVRPQLLLYGDHGMVNVVRGLDVEAALQRTGLQAPADFVYFIDSTSVRFWYRHPQAQGRIRTALASLAGGNWMGPEDYRRYGMEGIDAANGEDLFLAEPGVMLVPNFFHHARHLPKGMHGYAPEEPDNQGLFLLCGAGLGAPRAVGTVLPKTFHAVLRNLLFGTGDLASLLPECAPPDFAEAGAASRRMAEQGDLEAALQHIRPLLRPEDTVVLHGGFGRGEGTMIREDGRWRALNDYDVMVVGPEPGPAVDWKEEGQAIASELNLPYFDLGWMDREMLRNPPRSIFLYDFLNGSRVLHGDPGLLSSASRFAVADIAGEEGLRLVFNRIAGVFIGLTADALPPADLPQPTCEFLWIQASKLGIALADRRLLEWQAYDVSYAVRRRRFVTLARAAELPTEWIDLLGGCYEWKLRPDGPPYPDPRRLLRILLQVARRELIKALGGEADDLPGALSRLAASQPPGLHGDKIRCRASAALLLETLDAGLHPIPERLAAAAACIPEAAPRHASLWSQLPDPETARLRPLVYYEHLRRAVIKAWENLCH